MTPATARAVAVFVVVAVIALAARTEWQDRQVRGLLHDQQVTVYQSCLQRRTNVEATISLRAQLADVQGPKVAVVYSRFPLLVPDCGKAPR